MVVMVRWEDGMGWPVGNRELAGEVEWYGNAEEGL